jgi:hypothetical protein
MIAQGQFGKRRALRPSPAGLGLLRVGEFRGSTHMLPALPRPAAALGGAGPDKIALHASASPPRTAIINLPVLVPVSAHGSASERNCALASTICLTMANRS